MSAPVDPIIIAALCGLLGSLAIMLSITLRRPAARPRRRPKRAPASEPTVKMNALDLEALEETLPAPSQASPSQRVHELPILSQSQASRLVDPLGAEVPPAPPLPELPPLASEELPRAPSSAPVLLARPRRSALPAGRDEPLPDLRFDDDDDAPTRLDESPFLGDPEIPPPARLPTDLLGPSTPPPVPPAPLGQAPAPLPIYLRSTRARAGGSGTVPKGQALDEAGASSERPTSSSPPSFAYGDRSRRA